MISVVDGFLSDLQLRRGASPHTLVNYRRDLEHLCEWLTPLGIASWEQVNRATVRRWIAWMHGEGYARCQHRPQAVDPAFAIPLPGAREHGGDNPDVVGSCAEGPAKPAIGADESKKSSD